MAGSARGMPSVEDIGLGRSRFTLATSAGVTGSSDSSGSSGITGSSGSGIAAVAAIAEARRLQLEHRPVAAAGSHQLVVAAQLDHPPLQEHAEAIGEAHGREAVRDQD